MSPRTALVTGATGAIGGAIALELAHHHDYEIVLGCRDEDKAQTLKQEIEQASPGARIRIERVDLSLKSSIAELARRWSGPLHVLINNAAVAPRRRRVSGEGLELQFATNVMGYFWMMQAFKSSLVQAAPARVVNVASYWAGDLEMDDLQFQHRMYDNDEAYRQSKQADRMLTVAFARRWIDLGVTVNACHPGDVRSRLSRDLGFGGHQTAAEAAQTPVWLATSDEVAGLTGKYFEHQKAVTCRFEANRRAVEQLFARCTACDEQIAM